MTALLLTACVGMITGAFLIFRISPMDFTLGVFRRLTAGPKSIRDEINETTHRKKPGLFRREISEAQTVLQATGKEERFPVLCAASLLLFAVGAGIATIMNNLLLVPVLAAGMMFLPFVHKITPDTTEGLLRRVRRVRSSIPPPTVRRVRSRRRTVPVPYRKVSTGTVRYGT